MLILPDYFIAKSPSRGIANFFDEKDARDFAGTDGSVEKGQSVTVFHSLKEQEFESVTQLISSNTAYTEKGYRIVMRMVADRGMEHVVELFNRPVQSLGLSTWVLNVLAAAQMKKVQDIVRVGRCDMLKYRNFGKKSQIELETFLYSQGLDFEMFER